MMQTALSPTLVHRIEDEIHHVTVLQADRPAVDEFIVLIESLIMDGLRTAPEAPILMLVDVSKSGLPSIRYAYERGLEAGARMETAPPLYLAFIVRDRLMTSMINNLVKVVSAPGNQPLVRFFRDYEPEKAAAWLGQKRA